MNKLLGNQEGQVAFVIGAMLVTFFSLSVFVINTGVLVSAKINLQNAADMAAYSGAATQARQLNHISYLNYEMRRQFKKYLFRYYILGNMAQRSQPGSSNGVTDPTGDSDLRSWSPTGVPTDAFNVPAVCLAFNEQDNYCQQAVLKATPIVQSNPINIISVTTEAAQKTLEAVRVNNCSLIARTNWQTLMMWLYNTDPTQATLQAEINNSIATGSGSVETRNILEVVKGLTTGLGLVPKMIMLRERIRSLESYVNAPSVADVSFDLVEGWKGNTNERGLRERTVNAYLSAYHSLGPFNFRTPDITLTELMPSQQLLRLNDIRSSFTSYYIGYPSIPGGDQIPPLVNPFATGGQTAGIDCIAAAQPINVNNVPMGVWKDPSRLTYYAVKLESEVTGLIGRNALGLGPIQLTAYAAAKPFGSRIGPLLSDTDFVRQAFPPTPPPAGFTPLGVPNLAVSLGDGVGNFGWNRAYVAEQMFRLVSVGGPGYVGDPTQLQGSNIKFEDIKNALTHAMAPNPAEMGLYNIPNDVGMDKEDNGLPGPAFLSSGDRFQQFFGNAGPQGQTDILRHTFWAPIVDPAAVTSGTDVAVIINDVLDQALVGASPDFVSALKAGMVNYIDSIRNPVGNNLFESNEGFYTYTLENPLEYFRSNSSQIEDISYAGRNDEMLMDGRGPAGNQSLNSSWSKIKDANLTNNQGRTGYSVKFVSFKSLVDPDSMISGSQFMFGANAWTNGPDIGPAASLIQH